jgi:hypothetical protein
MIPDEGKIEYLVSAPLSTPTNSILVFKLHSQVISLLLTNRMKIVFLCPIMTELKSMVSDCKFSIVISGIVMLAFNSRLYLGPFFTSMGTTVTD